MIKDSLMRKILWATAIFNLGGAYIFAFPSSRIGQFAGMPTVVPGIYCALLSFFVLLFGGAYAYCASQEEINKTVIAMSAIGKLGAFLIIFTFFIIGQAQLQGVMAALGDFIFAILFTIWLFNSKKLQAEN